MHSWIGTAAFGFDPYLNEMGLVDDVPSKFDDIDAYDFEHIMLYLQHHYRIAYRKNQNSGSHADFKNFVGDKPVLLYYHLWLVQIPDLMALAVPSLPIGVGRDSDVSTSGTTDSQQVPSPAAFRQAKKKVLI